ncbi:FAD-binding protein [Solwaraspora sp. WMMD791]|uniref:FAD-dependent oxidoreductase n=1 Tax=Solwaraspora sp. WMMD791 TaxID=3016086 RepID=UPI00249A4FDE|nr:FAD-binding protein [Solwaraspora sp. WMMD791]WFE28335.1 FAD-binding protein [Solwaraspora sp. WMMD791]
MSQLTRRRLLAGTAAAGGGMLAGGVLAGDRPAVAAPTGVPAGTTADPAATGAVRPVTVTATDPRYPDLVRGTNQRWVGRPDTVCVVTSAAQVAAVVQQAVRTGTRFAVRSGGHCYEDFVTSGDIRLVIDLSQLTEVRYDPGRRAFSVGAGTPLGRVYQALYKQWGVFLPAGNCPTVAVGGHIAGGGYGSQSRRNGLAVDHLYAVEVVVVDASGRARVVVATREDDDPYRDLWWAFTGGGGGNFGVVTRYWLRSPGATSADPARLLPRPPSQVWIHEVAWPWESLTEDRFARLMRNHGEWHADNSAPDSPYVNLFSQLKPWHKAQGAVTMVTQVDADAPGAERMLADYVAQVGAGVGVAARVLQHRKVPWLVATGWSGFTGPDPTVRFKGKSAYLRASYPEEQLPVMYRHLTRTDFANPTALMMIASYGGQVNVWRPGDTAVPQRDSVIKMQCVTLWNDARDDAVNLAWVREFYRDLYAATGGVPVPGPVMDGCFVNYADVDLGDPALNTSGVPWHDLYYKDNYRRLQRIKARWDPRDVFRHAQSIRLPGSADRPVR